MDAPIALDFLECWNQLKRFQYAHGAELELDIPIIESYAECRNCP
jgi:hypothetical protein